ncbi:hypothetical protein [Jannaschia sp. M317]|uniref:hypothetical protein n=1 Tax=Jannaschia sp. M317 TaxID=2867011 RepID=UPI0021A8B4CC|nr:hypothetical protein [Jannaschia sp. M317]UWQ17580.1 hypothetical protein K3551_17165 [Jannaschia sp. M317]
MLSVLADIADLLAAFGVIASILVLSWELHQTRKQSELANWRDVLQTLSDYKAQATDPDLADLLVRGHADYCALTEAERLRYGMYLEQGVHIYGNFLKHNDSLPRKLIGLDDAIGNHFVDLLGTPGGAAWWAEARKTGHMMPATYRTVDAALTKGRIATDV